MIQARKIQSVCERTLHDELAFDYDQYNPFDVCAASFEPIYRGSPKVECCYCKASYKPEYEGKACNICEVAKIGGN